MIVDKDKILEAVLGLFKIQTVNQNNTWEVVRANRAKLLNSEDFPVLDGLESSWQHLEDFYNSDAGQTIIDRREDERLAESPLKAFTYYIELGFYPPPEIMLAVNDCFSVYNMCCGEIELEEAFFGARPKGKGNQAKRSTKGSLFKQFYFHVGFERVKEKNKNLPPKSLAKIAEEFWDNDFLGESEGDPPDIDSFLRGYRRWKENR